MEEIRKLAEEKAKKEAEEKANKEAMGLMGTLVAVGVIIIFIGFFLEMYREPVTFLGTTVGYDYPYAGILEMLMPISLLLIVLGVIGGILVYYFTKSSVFKTSYDLHLRELSLTTQHQITTALPTTSGKIYCRYCGAENWQDAFYCIKCGKKIGEA